MARSSLGKVFCLSLGCSKNKVDSERIIRSLVDAGFEVTSEAEGAEIGIVNTCGFIRSAVEENIAAILDLVELKSKGNMKKVGVVGCLVTRYGGELRENIPEVDFWAGCEDIGPILSSLSGKTCPLPGASGRTRMPGDAAHVRYLKISEGCDRRCSYCTIPSIRGGLNSRSVEDVVAEACALARDGAREICLVAQDLTAYGRDRGERDGLIALLDELESSIPRDVWLRLLYLQPSGVGTALLERVASGRQVLPYLDIPIQHSVSKILKLMNRGESAENLPRIFEAAREIKSDIALRTTCMVGFPGENRSDFDDLLRFLEKISFDRVGAFVFSPEEGTAAIDLPSHVSARTKNARLDRLMSLQAEISLSRQNLFVGRELDVMIDAINPDGSAEGRSFREAPEVDGVVEIASVPENTVPGNRIRVMVTASYEHDLAAETVKQTVRSIV
jgi:ribosomal protein S12 methylthiotransferase